MIEYLPRSKQHTELYLTQFGMEDCIPSHQFGPAVRTHYLLHYVFEGEGIFEVDGVRHSIGPGQGFLICPHVVTYYAADQVNPWSYGWIGFNGALAESLLEQAGLNLSTPILEYEPKERIYEHLQWMIQSNENQQARETRLMGLLYLMLSLLVEKGPKTLPPPVNSRADVYVEQVKDFIEMNFSQKITVEDIAHFIGLNRSYLCSLFTKTTKGSIQDYLIRYRMEMAVKMLVNTDLTIGNIARSVGYVDPLLFSKIFKRIKGMSPKAYRSASPLQGKMPID
ncbi:AraC family transcriptional regulator [Paenibacillus shenyangensis]|uniref:AraC family transcriptional regulator n=1 Tax=Paenibacillus sp. A9 TaxID=1284352 RepID=UPI0003766BD9|nr:AraC family transcriptional regulator [Paenibacillus sp. A9]